MPYYTNGSLTSSKIVINDSDGWDSQSEWEAYQSANQTEIVNGSVQLGEAPAIPDGIVSRWQYNDDSDTSTAIDSEGSNDGTINGATYTTSAKEGSHALSFDGTADYVETANPPGFDESITVMAWFYFDSVPNVSYVFNDYNDGSGSWFILGVGAGATNGNLMFQVDDGSNNPSVDSGVAATTDTWYHVVGVYDASDGELRIYVNGTLENTISVSISPTYDHVMRTGNDASGQGADHSGRVDDPMVGEQAASGSRIQSYYDQYA